MLGEADVAGEVSDVGNSVIGLSGALYTVRDTSVRGCPSGCTVLAANTTLQDRLVTYHVQRLLCNSAAAQGRACLTSTNIMRNVHVGRGSNILRVALPYLLPGQGRQRDARFLVSPLCFALDRCTSDGELPGCRRYMIYFSRVCDRGCRGHHIHSCSGLRLGRLLSILSAFVVRSSSKLLISTCGAARVNRTSYAHVSIVKGSHFSG